MDGPGPFLIIIEILVISFMFTVWKINDLDSAIQIRRCGSYQSLTASANYCKQRQDSDNLL